MDYTRHPPELEVVLIREQENGKVFKRSHGSPKKGTGSVDDSYRRGVSNCRRCLSPFSGGATGAAWKKAAGTEPDGFVVGFTSIQAQSRSPFFHDDLVTPPSACIETSLD